MNARKKTRLVMLGAAAAMLAAGGISAGHLFHGESENQVAFVPAQVFDNAARSSGQAEQASDSLPDSEASEDTPGSQAETSDDNPASEPEMHASGRDDDGAEVPTVAPAQTDPAAGSATTPPVMATATPDNVQPVAPPPVSSATQSVPPPAPTATAALPKPTSTSTPVPTSTPAATVTPTPGGSGSGIIAQVDPCVFFPNKPECDDELDALVPPHQAIPWDPCIVFGCKDPIVGKIPPRQIFPKATPTPTGLILVVETPTPIVAVVHEPTPIIVEVYEPTPIVIEVGW